MADASATFEINLQDGTSGAAEHAAGSLSRLRRAIDSDTKALAEMQRAMRNLQQGTVVNVQQFRQLKQQIDEKKSAIAQAQSAYLSLGGTFGRSARAGKPTIDMLGAMRENAQQLGGPLGGLMGRLTVMRGMLAGGAIALGIAAIAAGLVALAAAAIGATAALLGYGIAQANARRSELLRLEGMTKMRSMWGFAAGNAGEMQSAIDRVSASVALGRDKLEGYTAKLYKMGLRGENLSLALEGTAIKAAVLGDEAASSFAAWAAGAGLAGQSIRRLTDDVKARFGRIAGAQLLDLNVQASKLKEAFGALFSGLKIEGFLKSLASVTQLFSQNTATGRALKVIVGSVFQPMVNALEYLGPVAKRFFQGITITGLMFGIVVLRIRNWLRDTFGGSSILKGFDAMKAALWIGVYAGTSLIAMFGALAAVMALMIAPTLAGIYSLYKWVEAGRNVYKFFAGIKWGDLGRSIVDGIVSGLKNGARWVIDAIKGLGDTAMKAFRERLGIASPSKVFARMGLSISEGVESGVQAGTPAANAAVASMVDVPRLRTGERASAPAVSGAGVRPSASNVSLTIGDVHLHTVSERAADLAADFRRELERVLSGIAVQVGAPAGA